MAEAQDTQLEASIEIDAPADKVWTLVSDIPAMARWSPQVTKSSVKGGVVKEGAKFSNWNRQGVKRWPTNGKVVRFNPPSATADGEFAFRISENRTIWSFQLSPTATGTKVTQRRETPEGISSLSKVLTKFMLGGQEPFRAELKAGMTQTLERLKAEAEA